MAPPSADSTKDVEEKSAHRKVNKPLIEKRRRARINDCLAQLKSIVLEASNTKTARSSKLEKADILEMTVQFVKNKLHGDRETPRGQSTSPSDMSSYLAGYTKCLSEISKFLEQNRPSNPALQQRLLEHVLGKIKEQRQNNETKLPNVPTATVHEPSDFSKITDSPAGEVLDLSAKTSERLDEDKHKPETPNQDMCCPAQTHGSVPSAPVGFLCGGKLVLLLQIPQPMMSVYQSVNSVSQPLLSASQTINSTPQIMTQFSGTETLHSSLPKTDLQSMAIQSAIYKQKDTSSVFNATYYSAADATIPQTFTTVFPQISHSEPSSIETVIPFRYQSIVNPVQFSGLPPSTTVSGTSPELSRHGADCASASHWRPW